MTNKVVYCPINSKKLHFEMKFAEIGSSFQIFVHTKIIRLHYATAANVAITLVKQKSV